ncbi:hypothetical protein C8F04DRAFT_1147039 [Mycena alexandri]|uniref:DUF6533 domain-containing protein n=1 Tax=Mycena alexandri TaxID=1745969 RepID=A0AAD6S349_9AGAR|nr:hypothetical protein C8F04DRAFT_1147039 [Mycena alexandri]
MGTLDAIFEARLIPSTLCACLTILVYDLLCTLDQEILYVWPRPWSMSTALFLLNRYLPFVDTFLSFSAKFTRIPPETCLKRNTAVLWLSVFGIQLSEGILMLRTYAIWERKRGVLYFLCGLALCTFVLMAVFVQLETASLQYTQSDDLGCTLSHAGHVILFGYMMIMISETAIAVLTAIKAYRDLRRSRVPWILKLYQDGMLFYVYLLILSTANVLVPIFAPTMFANWLGTPQRVLHSVLCNRVLLLILRQRRIATSGTAHSVTTDSEATGVVFSSVVDGRTDSSLFALTVESSSSRREYVYPVSPGADEEEFEDGRSRFNWL